MLVGPEDEVRGARAPSEGGKGASIGESFAGLGANERGGGYFLLVRRASNGLLSFFLSFPSLAHASCSAALLDGRARVPTVCPG